MKYINPIVPGFYPDPSVCKKGEDYYMVTSSFEFFPGVPVFHSTDMVNWVQIGHCLTRKSQLNLEGIRYSRGIYAPTLRYNPKTDLFYMVTTNVSNIGNFYVYAKDPAGEWSEPICVDQGGIDPSLFFDEDGSAHFISNARERGVHRAGFLMGPIDLKTGKFLQEPTPLWGGIGGSAPEAPHIYKRNGWYYQLIAEGGTELNHMVTIARSRSLYGTYEPYPSNPILTHANQKYALIQATGHADLIEDKNGDWWAVFLGYRQTHQYFHHLGRETFLAPVEWVEDWPVINQGRPISKHMDVPDRPDVPAQQLGRYTTDFQQGLDLCWVHLRNPESDCYDFTPQGAILTGNAHTLSDQASPAFLGFRQQDLDSSVETDLHFTPTINGDEAGISVFYKHDAHLDVFVTYADHARYLCYRKVVGDIVHMESRLPLDEETQMVTLRIESSPFEYKMFASIGDARVYLGGGLTRYVSTEAHELGFTGTFYALYATGNGRLASAPARFTRFHYRGRDAEII